MPVRSLRDGTVKIADDGGTAGPDVVTVDVEEGDFAYTERSPINVIHDRGVLDHSRLADEEPLSYSVGMRFQSFSTHATITPYDAVTKTGGAAAWTSDEPSSDVYAVILELAVTDPAGGASETITIARAAIEEVAFAEGNPHDTLAFSGRAMVTRATLS